MDGCIISLCYRLEDAGDRTRWTSSEAVAVCISISLHFQPEANSKVCVWKCFSSLPYLPPTSLPRVKRQKRRGASEAFRVFPLWLDLHLAIVWCFNSLAIPCLFPVQLWASCRIAASPSNSHSPSNWGVEGGVLDLPWSPWSGQEFPCW